VLDKHCCTQWLQLSTECTDSFENNTVCLDEIFHLHIDCKQKTRHTIPIAMVLVEASESELEQQLDNN